MEPFVKVPAAFMRGGTSKGLIFKSVHLPNDPAIRDRVITRIYGSPDKRQIDGIGGGNPLSSKLAIVGPATRPDADVNYTFGQVSLDKQMIDYKPTCGNMATAVGLFAAEEGYVPLTEPITVVRLFNTNTGKMIETEVPVKNGAVQYEGDFAIDGVPGTTSRIMVNFLNAGGAITGKLLPTGHAQDTVVLENGRSFQVSVIDSANVVVFVNAADLNVSGPDFIGQFQHPELLNTLESIRIEAGARIGLIRDKREATPGSHALPKIAVFAEAQLYYTAGGCAVQPNENDILGFYLSMGQLHQAFAVSGGIALATGAQIPGTNIAELRQGDGGRAIRIGHPSGTIAVDVQVEEVNGLYSATRAAVGRTARRLMDGFCYVPAHLIG